MSGGGGGGNQQTQTQVTDLPDWAKPYAKKGLGQAEALTDIEQNPYQAYTGARTAEFTPLQTQAFQQAQTMAPSAAMGTSAQMAGQAGLQALNTQYNPYQTGQFTGQTAQDYMNPYMQNVVDIQKREAQRQADIAGTQRAGQATRAGAFGGARQAIMEAEANRNLAQQMGDIQAQGQQAAFQDAASRFAQEQQMREQSRQYGAGLGMQGLQTALTGAGQLANIGQQTFGQQMDINKLQSQYGAQQQALQQQRYDTAYQDFLNQQRYPYQQLEFMNSMLRGTPMGTVSTMYQPAPSALSQIAGIGTAAYGMSRMAKGGEVGYAKGGIAALDTAELDAATNSMSDPQMQQAMGLPNITALAKLQIEQKLAQNNMLRQAQARAEAAAQPQPQSTVAEEALAEMGIGGLDVPEETFNAAGGGIVAFAGGGTSYERRSARRLGASQKDSETNLLNQDLLRKYNAEQQKRKAKSDTVLPSTPAVPAAPGLPAELSTVAGIQGLYTNPQIEADRATADLMGKEAAESDVAAAQQQMDQFKADQAALGERGTEREKSLREQQEELKGKEDKNLNMALIEAGLAMMAGNSANAFENIGKGALVGTKSFKEGEEKLQARKDKLNEAIYALEDARFSDKKVDAETLRNLAKDVANAKTNVRKVMADNFRKSKVDAPEAALKAAVETHVANQRSVYEQGQITQRSKEGDVAAMQRVIAGRDVLDVVARRAYDNWAAQNPNATTEEQLAYLEKLSAAKWSGSTAAQQRADTAARKAVYDHPAVKAAAAALDKARVMANYDKSPRAQAAITAAETALDEAIKKAQKETSSTGGAGAGGTGSSTLPPGYKLDQ